MAVTAHGDDSWRWPTVDWRFECQTSLPFQSFSQSVFIHSSPSHSDQVGDSKKNLKFYQDGSENNPNVPFKQKPRNLARHMTYNPRNQEGVKQAYVRSVKSRGIVESVRGELWAVAPEDLDENRKGPYLLLSCASLVEAFYEGISQEPNNPNLLATVKRGIEGRVLSRRTPGSVCRFLTTIHNQFHHGASTNFLELIRISPEAVWPHLLLHLLDY